MLDSSLLDEQKNLLVQRLPPDGIRGIGSGTRERRGGDEKGMRYPVLETSATQGSTPLSLQMAQWRERQGTWLLLLKILFWSRRP